MADLERSLILIKPDGVQRELVGEILHRFERKGLKIIGLKLIKLDDELLNEHYAHILEKPFWPDMKSYMTQTPVVGMILEGVGAVEEVRKIVGKTNPREADAGTIRADLSMNMPSNTVHASDSVETAKTEIKRFFRDEEIFEYNKMTDMFHIREGV